MKNPYKIWKRQNRKWKTAVILGIILPVAYLITGITVLAVLEVGVIVYLWYDLIKQVRTQQ